LGRGKRILCHPEGQSSLLDEQGSKGDDGVLEGKDFCRDLTTGKKFAEKSASTLIGTDKIGGSRTSVTKRPEKMPRPNKENSRRGGGVVEGTGNRAVPDKERRELQGGKRRKSSNRGSTAYGKKFDETRERVAIRCT